MAQLTPIHHMLVATLFFSLMDLCVKFLVRIPTAQIVFFRAAVALAICIFFLRRLKIPVWGSHRLLLSLRGVFGTIALILYFYSIKKMPLASAVTVQKLSPVFTVFFAWLIRRENFRRRTWLYFALALLGAACIKGFDTSFTLPVFLLAVMAAVSAGLGYNCIAELKGAEHPYVVIFYFPLITLPLITPSAVTQWVSPHLWEWLLLIAVGIVVQTAQYFMTLAYQQGKADRVSVIFYLGTVLAVIYGLVFFGEVPGPNVFLGMALIILAVVQIQRLPQIEPIKAQ